MPINQYNVGDKVKLEAIDAKPELKRKLMDMGLTTGVKMKIINKTKRGPMLIEVRGTRLALSDKIATCISGAYV